MNVMTFSEKPFNDSEDFVKCQTKFISFCVFFTCRRILKFKKKAWLLHTMPKRLKVSRKNKCEYCLLSLKLWFCCMLVKKTEAINIKTLLSIVINCVSTSSD